MQEVVTFNSVLQEIEKLTFEEQETLMDVMNKRMIAKRRSELAKEAREAYVEYKIGKATPVEPDELMKEVLS